MKVIPAILEPNASRLLAQIRYFSPLFDTLQIDIADGTYVPNTTISLEAIATTSKNNPELFSSSRFDLHLMVNDYKGNLKTAVLLAPIVTLGVVFVHTRALTRDSIPTHSLPFSFGIAINPDEHIENIIKHLPSIQHILLMTVYPGFQGKPFIPEVLLKINCLKAIGYKGKIYLDGGINEQSLGTIVGHSPHPDMLCIGSYLQENTERKIAHIASLLSPSNKA